RLCFCFYSCLYTIQAWYSLRNRNLTDFLIKQTTGDNMLQDKKLQSILEGERERQRLGLELIPSENYVSKDVLVALGSEFTNKYSEGYPGRRYYGGQEYTDQVESIAIERAKQLFGADHANVQPHSGAPANMAVYQA